MMDAFVQSSGAARQTCYCSVVVVVLLSAVALLNAGCRSLQQPVLTGDPVRSVHVVGITGTPETKYHEPHAFLEMLSGLSGGSSGTSDFAVLVLAPFAVGAIVEEAIRLPSRLGRPGEFIEALEKADFRLPQELCTALGDELKSSGIRVTFNTLYGGTTSTAMESGEIPDLSLLVTSCVIMLEKRDVLFARPRYLPIVQLRIRGQAPGAEEELFDRWFEGVAPPAPVRRFNAFLEQPDRMAESYRQACREVSRSLGIFLMKYRIPRAT